MPIELVKVLAWPFAALVLGLVALLCFKKPLTEWISRVKRVKAGSLEAETSPQDTKREKIDKKEEVVQEQKYEEDKKAEVAKIERPKTLEEWRIEMIIAAFDRDGKRADEAYNEMMRLNQDHLSRKTDDALHLQMLHVLGDTSAIARLRNLASDAEVTFSANMSLAFCYEQSGDFGTASEFFSLALEKARTSDEKSRAASQCSLSIYRDGKKEQAIRTVVEVLCDVENGDKVRLYETLAEIYEKEDDYENRAFVLDKATELRPNDTSLIFKTAYSYSESNYDELSLMHYKNAKAFSPGDSAIQNNLGVQYDNLGMPIKSVACYQESHKLGETLASANLANRLIRAGFVTEASEILDAAKVMKNPHANVNSALSELPRAREREDEIEVQQLKSAHRLRKFFLMFAEARYVKGDKLRSLAGDWKSEYDTLFRFEVAGSLITATWKRKLFSYEYDWKLEGEMFNNSAIVTFHEWEHDTSTDGSKFKKKGRGFLFCSKDDDVINLLEINDSNHTKTIHTLTRNPVA